MVTLLRIIVLTGFALGSTCLVHTSHAQEYPAKSLRLIIPFPPGGASDILARTVAGGLTESLKQRVIVDNRPGGGGLIALEIAANSPPDGYSLMQIATSYVINPSLYKHLPYDAQKDFVPITILAVADNILVVHPSLPVKSVKEFIAFAKARPGELNYAHSGYGTQAYVGAELFKQMVNVNMVPVAYKGTPGALLDVISGQVHLMFAGAPSALPQIRAHKLRALAVTGKERLPELPEVPAVAEALPGFEASVWYGLLAPAGTPANIVARLNTSVNAILKMPAVKKHLNSFGFRTLSSTPEEFSAYLKSEGAKWAKVIKISGTRTLD